MNAKILSSITTVTLLVVTGFNALSAIAGGVGLLMPGSLGMPLSMIENSPFTSFFWPGIILLLVIGGSQVLAFVTLLRRTPGCLFWTAVAGFAMVIWIVVEVAIMGTFVLLHGIYFGTGIAQLALLIALLGVLPTVVQRLPFRASV